MGQRQVAGQATHIPAKNHGNGTQFFEGRIALASLDSADVIGRSIRFQREVLLGQPLDFAVLPEYMPQQLERSWLFQL